MDYKKIAYKALQRGSVSTIWSEDTIKRVADYLETALQNAPSNSDYETAFRVYCEYDQSNPNRHFDEWLSKRLNREIPDFSGKLSVGG